MPLRNFVSALTGFLFLLTSAWVWGDAVPSQAPAPVPIPTLQSAFWSAMSEQKYGEAGAYIEDLLDRAPQDQDLKFQKAELLWKGESPAAAIAWLSGQEDVLDKNEIVHFLNKMLPQFSKTDWIRFYASLMKNRRRRFNVTEAAILARELSTRVNARQPFSVFRDRLLRNFKEYPAELQFDVAVVFERYGFPGEGQKLYGLILKNDPDDRNAAPWIAKVYMRQKKYADARRIVERALIKDPDSYQLLLLKGELLEADADFLAAIKIYNHILRLYPSNQEAWNVKMRALLDLGANSLVLDELSRNPQADPVLLQRARGDLAMHYIRWDEPQEAEAAMASKEENKKRDYARARNSKVALDPEAVNVENNRTRWDSMVIAFQKDQFQDVIASYQQALAEGLDVPAWVLKTVADAYLFKHQPEQALKLYQDVLKEEPDAFEPNMALYYTLVDLGRFQEADELLESMDRREPVQVMDRGILRDNEHKAEITRNKIWLLMYQDRLKKAQKIGEQYLYKAPGDTQLRSAMAHLALWRGWPRRALAEFLIIRTMDPMFVANNIGYARALYENEQKKEARQMMQLIVEEFPRNRHVVSAQRQMDVDDMGLLTLSGYYTREMPGEDEFLLSARVDQPVTDHHQLFAELIRRETTREVGNDRTERFYAGDIYRPDNTWKFTDALTGDYRTGQKLGVISEVELTPDDFWTHTLSLDSRTIDVPLRSREAGIDVQDYSLSSRYRRSESFNTGVTIDFKNFEDGNDNWNYAWTTDSALATYAYWKWRLGTELDYSTYSKQDVDYYSPVGVYDLYLIPNVEHVWWRRYERGLVDRCFVGIGQQWERDFGAENVGYVRYEIEYQHSETADFTVGVVYALRNYDGQDMNALTVDATVKKRF